MGNQAVTENGEGLFGHERLGLIRVIKNPTPAEIPEDDCEELMVLSDRQMSRSQFSKWQNEIKSYKLEGIKEVLLLPVGEEIKSGGYCGSRCSIDLEYPSYTIVLREEIKNRYKIDKMYEETELWFLLYNMVLAGRHFELIGKKIGNVHPSNIMLNNEGWMKIISVYSIPATSNNFELICQSQLEDVFLAPEEIDYDAIKRGHYPTSIDPNQAELFSMGMTLLEAGTLELSTYTYDKGPYRNNFQKIQENLKIFKYKYSEPLYQILENLLSHKPATRKNCRQLFDFLQPYQNEILAQEPFEVRSRIQNNDSLHYSKSSGVMNQTTLLNLNQSVSQMAETKIISNSRFSNYLGNSVSKPMPINKPQERLTQPPEQVRFFSPRHDTLARKY